MKPSILSYSRVLRPLLIDWRLDEQLLQPALTLELQLLINATSSHQINEDLLSHIIQYHPHLNAAQLKNELIVLLSQHNITPTIPEMIHRFNPCLICALIHTIHIHSCCNTFWLCPQQRLHASVRFLDCVGSKST